MIKVILYWLNKAGFKILNGFLMGIGFFAAWSLLN
jgi:hypothetical protein